MKVIVLDLADLFCMAAYYSFSSPYDVVQDETHLRTVSACITQVGRSTLLRLLLSRLHVRAIAFLRYFPLTWDAKCHASIPYMSRNYDLARRYKTLKRGATRCCCVHEHDTTMCINQFTMHMAVTRPPSVGLLDPNFFVRSSRHLHSVVYFFSRRLHYSMLVLFPQYR